MKKKVLSGMRPTGRLHLGHYFGALKNWVELQDEYECYYMSADWHALTTDYADTSKINDNTFEMAADWITAGIEPEKSVIFKQSEVPQHSELFLILSMLTPLGWLYRCPTYKEQLTEIKNKDLHNIGFLGYPVLQAADILLYMADIVPVGEDQLAHLEMTREITRRFNNFYGNVLTEPQAKLTKSARVPGTDARKMSKSYGNSVFLGEDDDGIKKKVQEMYTDPLKIKKNDAGHPDGCVVFAFHKIFNKDFEARERECKAGSIGCVACKKQIMEMLSVFMKPLAEKRAAVIRDKAYLERVIKEGTERAREAASSTMTKVKKALKF
ncbi:MAG: tryptophan--tRNA ligase [Endomicrobia bacterium]|nr:tryptophan--tRNA ligase [Endomicrobiia bacterium]